VNYTVCSNQSWIEYNEADPDSSKELNALIKRLCSDDLELDWDECLDECPPPCSEVQYFTTSSHSSPWPQTSYQLAIYKEFIKESDYESRFADYAAISDKLDAKVITVVSVNVTCILMLIILSIIQASC
jgi:Amiloride-sensitive sodium channel